MEKRAMTERLIIELICPQKGSKGDCGARVYERIDGSAEKCRLVLDMRSRITDMDEFVELLLRCETLYPSAREADENAPCLAPISG